MTAEASTLPWSFRLVEATRAPLLLVGLGVAVAYLCFFVLVHNLAGGMDGLRMEGRPFWLDRWGTTAFTYSLLIGYMIIVVSHLMRFASAHLRDLHPVLTLNPSEIAEFDAGLRRVGHWPLRLVGIAGVSTVLVMDVWWIASMGTESRPQPWAWWVTFTLTMDCVLAWLMFRMIAIGFVVARRFSWLGERHTVIDLFDFRGVRPFTRLGLRLALMLLIAFAITMTTIPWLFTITDLELLVTSGVVMLGIPATAGAVLFLLALRGVHRAIVAAKELELDRVRAEVAREREAMVGGNEERKSLAIQRLPDLLDYQAHVERVRDWSFGFPALLRFALYVLIPLGSWVAAAFVERALGLALE
jgi:hypothetical protein